MERNAIITPAYTTYPLVKPAKRGGSNAWNFVLRNADVIRTLEKILKANTENYQTDFAHDKKALRKAAKALSYANDDSLTDSGRNYLWMSRRCGTWLFREEDVLLKQSCAYQTWNYYSEMELSEHPVAVSIYLKGIRDNKIIGDIYTVDYVNYCKHLKQEWAVDSNFAEITYKKGSIIPESNRPVESVHKKYGEFVSYKRMPDDKDAHRKISDRLMKERRQSRCCTAGDANVLLTCLGLSKKSNKR